jgi:hypothetical protein
MKKTIKLTESKLIELIEGIVAEQQSGNMIPKPTTNKFLPPPMSNEPELTKPEPGPETYEEAKELNAFNQKLLALKNKGSMSPEQFMLQYNKANPSRPIKNPNDSIIPYVTTDKFMPPARSNEPELTKPEPAELEPLQESINRIIKRFKKTISEQEVGGYKEGQGEKLTPELKHFNTIVKPQLSNSGFKHVYEKVMEPYGTENSMVYGNHNTGVNVVWDRKKGVYSVYVGNNKELKTFSLGPNDPRLVANNVVKYAISLKNGMSLNEEELNESNTPDPKRIAFFDNLAKQISTKIVGKKYFFGKIGVLDNTSIIVKRYEDRNQAINLPGYPVKEFNLYFLVRRVEEDLYKNEKPGTRVWTGLLSINANFVNGRISPNPLVELYPVFQGKTDFNSKMVPTKPWTWDMIGGATIWANATTIEKKPIQGVPGPGPTNMQGGLRQIK